MIQNKSIFWGFCGNSILLIYVEKPFVVGFPSGILDNESRKRSEPHSGSTRFTPEKHEIYKFYLSYNNNNAQYRI